MPAPETLRELELWKGLKSIGMATLVCVRDGKETAETRYYISSLAVSVKQFAHAVRSHWGIENSEKITDEQRELARWLIDRGVDLVVGSHPHCVQPLDFYHGCPIAYSLGNLVFDGAPTVASWNRGALLEVGLNEGTRISSGSLIPVVLEDGLPRVEITESNRFGSR